MTKKLFKLILIFSLILTTMACSSAELRQDTTSTSKTEVNTSAEDETPINLVAMKGPTAMGLAYYTSNNIDATSENIVNYEIMTMPDQVATGLIKGEIDLACIPANLAATVYNKSEGQIQVAAINVLNVLYIATNEVELNSLDDLKGKTIYTSGKGASPDAILNNLLTEADLEIGSDVSVKYYPEATEVAALLQAEEGAIALLQEPFLSSVIIKNDQIKVSLDINQLWQNYFGSDSGVVTGVLAVRKEFVEQNKDWFEQFIKDYADSVEWINSNPVEAATIIEEQDIIGAAIAEQAIPNCGISLITGSKLKEKLAPYLEKLASNNPQLIGGSLPADDFYYGE